MGAIEKCLKSCGIERDQDCVSGGDIEQARAELAELRLDRERLDARMILIKHVEDEWGNKKTLYTDLDLRAAIDAAMKAKEAGDDSRT